MDILLLQRRKPRAHHRGARKVRKWFLLYDAIIVLTCVFQGYCTFSEESVIHNDSAERNVLVHGGQAYIADLASPILVEEWEDAYFDRKDYKADALASINYTDGYVALLSQCG